jgi:hypothetical protein
MVEVYKCHTIIVAGVLDQFIRKYAPMASTVGKLTTANAVCTFTTVTETISDPRRGCPIRAQRGAKVG